MPFADTWNALQAHLTPCTTIPNWTASKGLLGDSFVVSAVGPNHIEVDAPNAQNRQKVPVADFQTVYPMWNSYCLGQTARAAVRDATRFSKYVISVLHWLEQQIGGQLP
ncbi:MAG: hypothetical protein ACLQOO_16955 [Terriglobia bacterium]